MRRFISWVLLIIITVTIVLLAASCSEPIVEPVEHNSVQDTTYRARCYTPPTKHDNR